MTLGLSRIIAPSTHGLELSGTAAVSRPEDTPGDGELSWIRANPGGRAFKGAGQSWWLTEGNWLEVAALLKALESGRGPIPWSEIQTSLPKCVARAVAWLSKMAFQNTAHVRYVFLVACLEGMLVQGLKDGVSRVLRKRLVKACAELPFEITQDEIVQMYEDRSSVAHSVSFSDEDDVAVVGRYRKLERMLAAILKRAILDDSFRSAFSSPEALAARWPIVDLEYCKVSRDPTGPVADYRSCLRE